jgi:hypothetical protein
MKRGWAVFLKGTHLASSPIYETKAEGEAKEEEQNRFDPGNKGRRFVGQAIQQTEGGPIELDTEARGGEHLHL